MRTYVTLLALSITLGEGFTIPAHTPDGSYLVTHDALGSEVHRALPPAALLLDSAISANCGALAGSMFDGPNTPHFCGPCDVALPARDCDAAVADLQSQCGQGQSLRPSMAIYAIRGAAVAFACSLWANDLVDWDQLPTIDGYKVAEAARAIATTCGLYVAGAVEIQRHVPIGYMAWEENLDFCAMTEWSPLQSCPLG